MLSITGSFICSRVFRSFFTSALSLCTLSCLCWRVNSQVFFIAIIVRYAMACDLDVSGYRSSRICSLGQVKESGSMVTIIPRSHSHSSLVPWHSMNLCMMLSGTLHWIQLGSSHRLGLRWCSLAFVGSVSAATLKYMSAILGSAGMYILGQVSSGLLCLSSIRLGGGVSVKCWYTVFDVGVPPSSSTSLTSLATSLKYGVVVSALGPFVSMWLRSGMANQYLMSWDPACRFLCAVRPSRASFLLFLVSLVELDSLNLVVEQVVGG